MNGDRMRRWLRRIAGFALILAVASVGTPAFADHDGTLDPHEPEPPAALVLPDTGFDAASVVTVVGAQVGPLVGSVCLVALSLSVITFGARKIMRYVTGRA